jgi:hypothetical protein
VLFRLDVVAIRVRAKIFPKAIFWEHDHSGWGVHADCQECVVLWKLCATVAGDESLARFPFTREHKTRGELCIDHDVGGTLYEWPHRASDQIMGDCFEVVEVGCSVDLLVDGVDAHGVPLGFGF